jgi:hypothetical protein
MRRSGILAVLIPLLLAGCSWSDVLLQEMKSAPPNASFGWQQGYKDGCKTGIHNHGGIAFDKPAATRDEERIKTEKDYAAGWAQGERNCSERHRGLVLTRNFRLD